VYGWVRGKYACVDLIGVFPLVGLTTGDFTIGRVALNAASNKVAEHDRACSDDQYASIPFVFDIFGFRAPNIVNILKKVQRVMYSNMISTRSLDVVFKTIDFAIQNELAVQLIACLSFIQV
jgi:hypothetical protein